MRNNSDERWGAHTYGRYFRTHLTHPVSMANQLRKISGLRKLVDTLIRMTQILLFSNTLQPSCIVQTGK
jgi:hypothetical protein